MGSSSLIQLELQDIYFCSYRFHILNLKHILGNMNGLFICIAYLRHTDHLNCSDQSIPGRIDHNKRSDPLL